MNQEKFNDLSVRAAEQMSAEHFEGRARSAAMKDMVRKLEAETIVKATVERMKADGEAFELSNEEEKMLIAFRRFKLRMRRHGEVFRWQSRMPEGVLIAEDTAFVAHPGEQLEALACETERGQ